MTVWRADPQGAARALLAASIDDLGLAPDWSVLTIDQPGAAPHGFAGLRTTRWDRRFVAGGAATAEPPSGPFDAALLRLPKSKDELEMTAHLACGVLRHGGRLFVYGGNDEGIKTAATRLQSLGVESTTLATRLHGRIIAVDVSTGTRAHVRARLDDWRVVVRPGWISYPGLFAEGAEDAGTALLIAQLPRLPSSARVLDYGCGPGAIAAAVRARSREVSIDAIDVDAVALRAVVQNVASVDAILGQDLSAVVGRRYDLIVSNPPLHSGVREDRTALTALIADASRHLTAVGRLMLVVQRRVPLLDLLQAQFADVAIAAETGLYRVWGAATPCPRK